MARATAFPLYAEAFVLKGEAVPNGTSSAHCLKLSTVPKQWHWNIQGGTALFRLNQDVA